MNKTKIQWADYSWNPVTGCYVECDYCYARKNATRFAAKEAPSYTDGIKPIELTNVPYPWGFNPHATPGAFVFTFRNRK